MNSNSAPFDANAQGYDLEFTETQVGKLQRALTNNFLEGFIQANKPKTVLELNCGTGADALWMAQKGLKVTATDLSSEMVRLTAGKTQAYGVQTIQTGIQGLEKAVGGQKFDLIWSNFGGFNCLSAGEIEATSASISQLLNPGGQFVAVVMGNFCAWETLYFLAKFKFGEAFRRLKKGPIPARLTDEIFQDTYYFSPKMFEWLYRSHLRPVKRLAIGAFLPPSYLDPFFNKRPNLLARMARWENKVHHSRFPATFSDHFLVAFELK